MSQVQWQLAQVNIGRIRAPMNDPVMEEFAGALAEINALAEQSAGFVGRLKGDNGDATEIQAFSDPLILVNMFVWTDVRSLRDYVYRTMHGRFFARRQAWFEKYEGAHLALWWIAAGQFPTTAEAKARLATITARGSSAHAFTFRETFPPPETSTSL